MSSRRAVAVLALGLVVAASACGGEATPAATATRPPEAATATPTRPPQTPTPTPGVVKELRVEAVRVDGDTVTVELHVFAGIDVRVTLEGREPDEVAGPVPTPRFIFRDMAPGSYLARVRDVVGFEETFDVVVAR